MNHRRKLLVVLGGGFIAAPLAAFAQQKGKVWRVGFLIPRTRPPSLDSSIYGAFPRAMHDLGYVEGKNLSIEWRYGDGKFERLPGLAAELVQQKVDVIVATTTPGTSAAQKATTTLPIVMVNVGDPVASGFVASLARPGGNITGLTNISADVSTKHLEMLLGMVPRLSHVAVLVNPVNSANAVTLRNVQAAAPRVNVKILPLEAGNPQEIDSAFARMTRESAGAVIVIRDPFFQQQNRQIAEVAIRHRIPSVFGSQEHVEAGGLMSYGSSNTDEYRRAATFVDKILKGAKPGDLPVEQPTKFELVINRKTANALGLTIPQSMLIGADRVIE